MAKEEMKYFRIKNWEKYQHKDATRNGRMPWVKYYTSQLTDYKMRQLSPSKFGLWARLVLLVGEIGNHVALDQRYLRASLAPVNFQKRLDLQFMWDLDLIEESHARLDIDTNNTQTQTKSAPADAPADAPAIGPQKISKITPKKKRIANSIPNDLLTKIYSNLVDEWNRSGFKKFGGGFFIPSNPPEIRQELENYPDLDYWKRVIEVLKNAEWIRNGKNTPTTFSYIFKNHFQIMEGRYDEKFNIKKNDSEAILCPASPIR